MRPRPEPQTLRETIRAPELQFPCSPGALSRFLQTGQQDGQHGFLHMETVLRFGEDLVGVLFKDSGGDLLSPVRRQTVRSMASGFAPSISLLVTWKPAKSRRRRSLSEVPGAVFHAAVTTTSASFTPSAGSVSR